MPDQTPSRAKMWVQMQVGKALFKIYQAKTALRRFGKKPTSGAAQEDETTSLE